MNRSILTAVFALLGSGVLAQAPQRHLPNPDEFALQLALHTSGANGVVQLQLPIEVYLASRSAGLSDLRVYNGAGQLLPYHLDLPETRAAIEQREQAGVLFPYMAPLTSASDQADLQMELRVDADGALQWRSNRQPVEAPTTRLQELIVDLGPSERHERLGSLRFERPPAQPEYRARLSIARSEDLKLWDNAAQASLDWLSSTQGSLQLVNDRVDLPAGSGRYLRIRWLDGEPALFAAVHGRWVGSTIAAEPMLELALPAASGRIAGDYMYATSPAVQATEIGLELQQQNTVMPVSIGFYREQPQRNPPWRFEARVEATFYRLLQDGRERRSGRIQIQPLSAAHWVLRLQQADQLPPELILRWRPQRLIFNAQGSDFLLAVGADPARQRQWLGGPSPIAQVAPGFDRDELIALEHARVGEQVAEVAIAAPITQTDADPQQRRRWILWGVLGLGVLLLAGISWRLLGQLNAGEQTGNGDQDR